MTQKTGVALFTYNRPAHTDLALAALARCRRLGECRVHVFCDGPRSPEQAASVAASKRVVERWTARLDAIVVEHGENLGLARSIVGGVGDLCDTYGRAIVVEDDLIVSPDFLDYMLQALDRYAAEEQVYQISGFMFPAQHPPKPDAFFLPFTTTWGWATWARAWRIFDWQASGALEQLADPGRRKAFDLAGSYPYTRMLRDRLAGRNQSWGILWYWAVFQANGLALHPRQSLVRQGGFDGTGVHSGRRDPFAQPPEQAFTQDRLAAPIAWPAEVTVDTAAMQRVVQALRLAQRPQSWVGRLKQMLHAASTRSVPG
jgi:hypothetical protein